LSYTPNLYLAVKWLLDEDVDAYPHIIALLTALNCNTPVCAILHAEEELLYGAS
jgi:hypothetical protein